MNNDQIYRIKINFDSKNYKIVEGDIYFIGYILYSISNHRNTIIQETMIFNDKIFSLEFYEINYIESGDKSFISIWIDEQVITMKDKKIKDLIDKSMDLYVKDLNKKKESVIDNE